MIFKIIFIVIISCILFLCINPVFGSSPTKEEKSNYAKRAKNYLKGKFFYPKEYEELNDVNDTRISHKGKSPKGELPMVKPTIDDKIVKDQFTVTWLGHSSLLIQMSNINILIDPVFSEVASPLSFIGPKRFSKAPISIEELPLIDVVIISHNHYDHLDMQAIKKLDGKVKKYIVPLGINKYLERWKIDKSKIESMAWWEEIKINGLKIACTPARHFSNRQVFDMAKTLYASWVLKDDYYQIYASGDGGYGGHFKEIHKRYGDFDFVMMENGQYNVSWHDIHMFPEEAVQAAKILGAKISMPIHWGAFVLSNHAWDDSVERFLAAAEKSKLEVITPKLGETVYLDKYTNYQEKWWHDIE